jgi:ABC-type lipoprotein export system ATPase subunit/GNAT superfamily N-acetyltransferase
MKVKTIKRLANMKLVTFDTGETLEVATSARVSKEDEIVKRDHGYFVICDNGEAQISPTYSVKKLMVIGGLMLPVEIKEPTTEQEFDDIEWLQKFHYLGEQCLKLSTLIVTTSLPNLPHTLGFIILATALNACKPRTPVVKMLCEDAHFAPAWFAVRFVRVVVHPEFRGTGVAKLLIEQAIEYSKKRFAITKHKPIIAEIVAAMLRYSPFVNRYMYYLGDTADAKTAFNLSERGLTHQISNKGSKSSGAKSYYENYLKKAREIAGNLDVSIDAVFNMVKDVENLDIEKRVDIQKLLHSPKPFYAVGLNDEANKVVKSLAKPSPIGYRSRHHSICTPIIFKSVEVTFEESAKATERTLAVQEAFGVSPRGWKQTVLKDFTLEIKPGEIVLLTGISGSGKSIVLRAIQNRLQLTRGWIIFPKDAKVATLEEIKSDEPLIDLVGETIEEAFYTLNKVGLGEAKLYMKPYKTLSTGQKYRACIAKLIDSDANIWIADEFGSTLDIITANVVASSVQRHCRSTGITFIAACANPESYLNSLKPDYIIDLSAGRTRITRMEQTNEV